MLTVSLLPSLNNSIDLRNLSLTPQIPEFGSASRIFSKSTNGPSMSASEGSGCSQNSMQRPGFRKVVLSGSENASKIRVYGHVDHSEFVRIVDILGLP